MKEQCQERLEALRAEYESGQKLMVNLQTKQRNLQHTLLRINGAIQVLEELSSQEDPASRAPIEDPLQSVAINRNGVESARQDEVAHD